MKHTRTWFMRAICVAASLLLLAAPVSGETVKRPELPPYGAIVSDTATITGGDGSLQLTVDAATGVVQVTDSLTGKTWLSNPVSSEEDPTASVVSNDNVMSQLLIRYNGGGTNLLDAAFYACQQRGEGTLVVYQAPDVVTAVYEFTTLGITVPVQYRFDGRSLVAAVPDGGVIESGDCALVSISILPYYGAGDMNEEGYILLPDGAGALVNFNNGKISEGRLELETLYGDRTKTLETPAETTQPVLLPGFGFCHETAKAGLFCYAAQGAHGGTITANVAGRETGLNYAYYTFLYRSYDTQVQMENTYMSKAKLINDSRNTGAAAYEMRYVFLQPDNYGLGGMADACRSLVFGDQKTLVDGKMPLLVDLYTGVRVRTNFLGIPYNTLRPLTTFQQAEQILEELKQAGVDNSVFRLLGVDRDGAVGGRAKDTLKPASSLGGKAGLLSLQEQGGVTVYPEVELVSYTRGGGLFASSRMALNLLYEGIEQSAFTVASGMVSEETPTKLIKAASIMEAASSLKDSLSRSGVKGISSTGLGRAPYADFTRSAPCRLEETAAAMKQAAATLSTDQSLLLSAPTVNTLPLADVVTDLPVRSSGYLLEDTEVPFLQMVLSGHVVYGGEDVNLSGDPRETLLRTIETGSALSASLMWEDYESVKKTGLNHLYACTWSQQAESLTGWYGELQEVLGDVWGTQMIDVTVITNEARAVTYANGTRIAVNYGEKPVKWKGQTVPAGGYFVYDGGEDR